MNVGEVDCKQLKQLCAQLGLWSFPNLKLYPKSILSATVDLEHNMMNMYRFPQIGMLRLFDVVSRVLLDHILIEQRRNALPQKLKNIMKFAGDLDRMEEIPQLMKVWEGAEQRLWDSMLVTYKLTEDMYENDVLPFIEELKKDERCVEHGGESTCYQ